MQAEVKVVVTFKDTDVKWVHLEKTEQPDEKQVAIYTLSRIFKIKEEGGILEMKGDLSWKFSTWERIETIDASAHVIQVSLADAGDMTTATARADAQAKVDEAIKEPGVLPFRRLVH